MGYWRSGKKLRFHKPARIASVAAADLRLMVKTNFVVDRQPFFFSQLFSRAFHVQSHHGACDGPRAAIVKDLKQCGLLGKTRVIWAGEFARTVDSQGSLTKDTCRLDFRLTDVHGNVVKVILQIG